MRGNVKRFFATEVAEGHREKISLLFHPCVLGDSTYSNLAAKSFSGLGIPRHIFRFLVINFNAGFFHALVHLDPSLMQVGIEIRLLTGELRALKAEVYALLLVA